MLGIGMESGSGMAGRTFSPIQVGINNQLKTIWNGQFTAQIEKCIIAFRVSGDIKDFNFVGTEQITFRKRNSSLSIEVGIAEAQWKNRPEIEVRALASDLATEATNKILAYLQEKNLVMPDQEKIDATFRVFEEARQVAQ